MFIWSQQSYCINSHDFHWGCRSASLIEGALPCDPPTVGVMGVRKQSMNRRCLQLARWWLEYDPLWWKGRFRPTSAQCPLVGAFRHSFHFFFYFSCINIFPPADGGGSSKNKSYASTSLKYGATITLLTAILSGNIFLIRDEKIYMLWSIVLQKSFAKQAHQSYLRIQQIRSMSQWQECGVWIFIHWNCSNKWYRHYWHERHLLIISRNNMLNDSSKNHQINNFYDLGKLKDIGCFNLLTNFWPGKRWIKNRSVAIYRTTTV